MGGVPSPCPLPGGERVRPAVVTEPAFRYRIGAMTTEAWYDALTQELLAQSPFRRSEYFKRFAAGALSREQVWGHIAQHYLLIAWFPRIFSGIHTRCEDLEVRKDCARHLLVEDLGYFEGKVGGTPDHDELFRRIGDDLGYPRAAYSDIKPVPEMAAIIDFFRRLAQIGRAS